LSQPNVHVPDVGAAGTLLRILGAGFGIAVVIGTAVSASFYTSTLLAGQLPNGPLILLAWLLGGAYALLEANYLAELGTMLPKAGGPYVYARAAFGDYGGFAVGWTDWMINTTGLGAVAIISAQTAALVLPGLSGNTTAIADAAIVLFAGLNWLGLRAGQRAQKVFSASWAIILTSFIIIAFGFGHVSVTTSGHNHDAGNGGAVALTAFLVAQRLVLYAYSGWNAPLYFAEEHTDAGRQLPRALFAGVALTIVLYLLVNAAFLHVLTLDQLASAKLPVVESVRQLLGDGAATTVSVLTMVAVFSSLNANTMFPPRTLFALSRDGLFFRHGAAVGKGGTPKVALALTMLTALGLVTMGSVEAVLGVFGFISVSNDVVLILAFMRLRLREPLAHRPYRAWGYPWTVLLLLGADFALIAAFAAGDPRATIRSLVLLLASVPIFLSLRRRRALGRWRDAKPDYD
jgi:basic amino acid/polyamine antiporter, APA family